MPFETAQASRNAINKTCLLAVEVVQKYGLALANCGTVQYLPE